MTIVCSFCPLNLAQCQQLLKLLELLNQGKLLELNLFWLAMVGKLLELLNQRKSGSEPADLSRNGYGGVRPLLGPPQGTLASGGRLY